MTVLAQRAGLTIAAPREILPRVYFTTTGFADIAPDAVRWLMLFRVYMPATFALTLLGVSFAALGWLLAVIAAVLGQPWALGIAVVLTLLRTAARALMIARLWGRAGLAENRLYLLLDPITTPIAAALNTVYVWRALFTRRTEWGGITYQLDGPQRTKVLARRPPA